MRRSVLGLIVTLALGLLLAPLAATAQQPRKVCPGVGFLSSGFPHPDRDPPVDAFRQGSARTRVCRGPEPRHRVPWGGGEG